jgi:hypothetical protein
MITKWMILIHVFKLWLVLQVGLDGEKLNIFTEQGSHKFEWTKVNKGPTLALTWYNVLLFLKTYLHRKVVCGFESELICNKEPISNTFFQQQ